MTRLFALAVVYSLIIAPAGADEWNEIGDAPALIPGQAVVGPAVNLDFIHGSFLGADDVDLYQIFIFEPDIFMASTVDLTAADTQLFLFDINGNGVTHNDDNEFPGVGLQSLLTDQFVQDPGIYYLAVTQYNNDALSPDDDLIWNNTPFREERTPDGPGAPGPLNSWTANFGGQFSYSIELSGVQFIVVNPCPADFDNSGDVGVPDLLFLLGTWGPCPGDPPKLVYSHEFVEKVPYCPGDPQYDDWLSYRASLPTSGVMSITVSGSQDPKGRTCSVPAVAQQIADAMRAKATISVECGGFTWRVEAGMCQFVGDCSRPDNDLVLSVGGEGCFCDAIYVLRPGIGNDNWGGITGGSCFVPTQTMTVTIE